MKKYFTFLIVFLFAYNLNAGFDPHARGGRSASMANNSVTSTDFWGTFNNQAAMAWNPKMSVGAFFENRYLLKELNTRGVGLTFPVSSSDVFGLTFSQFGYSAYNESKVGLSFAKVFANKVAAGLQLDYLHTGSTIENGSKGVFTFEFGIQSKVSKKMMIGFYAFNPVRSVLSDYNGFTEYVPVVLRFGVGYKFSEKFMLEVETEKDLHYDAILRIGGDYKINERFFVRGGMSTGVVLYSIGVGTKWNGFTFDIASSYHQVLGVSPMVSLNYDFSSIFKKTVPSL